MTMRRELQNVQAKFEEIGKLLDDVKQAVATDELSKLSGRSTLDSKFVERLDKRNVEKQRLADYLVSGDDDPFVAPLTDPTRANKTWMVESGTTFARLLTAYAEEGVAVQPKRVRTNSLIVLTGWGNLVPDVVVEPGSFMPRYYGFFPFSNDPDAVDWSQEAASYETIKADVQECDTVLATCSRFSLLAGPVVGSRANAIFKHALFTGSQAGERILIFDFSKIIPCCSTPLDFPDYLQHKKPSANDSDCYGVLQPEGEIALDTPWHKDWFDGHVPSAGREFFNGMKRKKTGTPLGQFYNTWLDEAATTKVLIGLPKGREKLAHSWLSQKELKAVNEILRDARGCEFKMTSESVAITHKVIGLEYSQC